MNTEMNKKSKSIFHLGQLVETLHGIGIIVKLEMPFNGLYTSPQETSAVVWYGKGKGIKKKSKWISFTYNIQELHTVEKLNKLNK